MAADAQTARTQPVDTTPADTRPADPSAHSESTEEGGLSAFCPRFHHAVELVGRRWTGAILRAMLSGRVRFSDLAATVPGLSDRLLSERLKELAAEGLIERTVGGEGGRVEYHLTRKGLELTPVIEALSEWAETWVEVDEAAAAAVVEASGWGRE